MPSWLKIIALGGGLVVAFLYLAGCFKELVNESAHNAADEAQKAADCAKKNAPGSQAATDAQRKRPRRRRRSTHKYRERYGQQIPTA